MKARAKKFWQERSDRERKVLILASAFLASSLLYAFVWQPGEKAESRLGTELPQLRSKLLEMRSEASEIARLKKAAAPASANIRKEIEDTAKASGIGLSRIESGSDGKVHAEFASVSFDKWIAWLDKARTDIRFESGHIQRIDPNGTVRIEATFAAWGQP